MQKNINGSTFKIVTLLVLICTIIVSSLFLYKISHPNKPETILSTNSGAIFPIGREINSFELMNANTEKFSKQNFLHHWTLVLFGFTHCSSVCPTSLEMLKKAYAILHPRYPTLQVVLVSLDPERDTPEKLAQYTHSFNENFIGVTGKIQEIRKLQGQLHVFSSRDPDTSGNNYQLQHTSSIMLINPKGNWAGLFKFGLTPIEFANAFEESISALPKL